jgi:hypothetical protein
VTRRPLGLRARLVTTFALVAALVAVAVAGISYAVVRYGTLQRSLDEAVREARVHLDDAAATLADDPRPQRVRRFVARVESRSLADVVALTAADPVTTSISLTEAAVPDDLRDAVDAGRIAAVRTVHAGGAVVVVGGAVRPAGPRRRVAAHTTNNQS